MDARLVALRLFLETLDIPAEIDTVDDRKRVQKAVYLGQAAGVDLGYRFGWYLMGPYSPGLTRDYYSLAEAATSGDQAYRGKRLRESAANSLKGIAGLMAPPAGVPLRQEDWLELVSSLHFLLVARRLGTDEALRVLQKEKLHLSAFAPQAEAELRSSGLLS